MRWWNTGTHFPEGCWMPHPWKHSSHVGWGSEYPDLVEDVPAHFERSWTRWPLKIPSNPEYSRILHLPGAFFLFIYFHLFSLNDGIALSMKWTIVLKGVSGSQSRFCLTSLWQFSCCQASSSVSVLADIFCQWFLHCNQVTFMLAPIRKILQLCKGQNYI